MGHRPPYLLHNVVPILLWTNMILPPTCIASMYVSIKCKKYQLYENRIHLLPYSYYGSSTYYTYIVCVCVCYCEFYTNSNYARTLSSQLRTKMFDKIVYLNLCMVVINSYWIVTYRVHESNYYLPTKVV